MRLDVSSLGHHYPGSQWLFRDVSYTFLPGATYAVTGPSGSGKSTLLGIVAGWTTPVEGQVTRTSISRTSWVFQSPHGSPRRTTLDHVARPFLDRGAKVADAENSARLLLSEFALDAVANRDFRKLSGGEAQRMMLARAAAADPDLLLVDEPTAQLDSATGRTVNRVIASLAKEGRIVLVATHDEATRAACTDHLDLANYFSVSD